MKKFARKSQQVSFIGLFKVFSGVALAATISLLPPVYGQQIQVDGNTNTNLSVNGKVTDVSTSTILGKNAFNSFKTFNVDAGNTVNLHVPNAASNLINIVKDQRTEINGTLNSIQNGQIGGNIYLLNPHGIVVGSQGMVNVGSLTAITPTQKFVENFFESPNNPSSDAVISVLNGTVPINTKSTVVNNGQINTIAGVNIQAGSIDNTGNIYTGAVFAHTDPNFSDVVNINTTLNGDALAIENGEIVIKSTDVFSNTGKIVSSGSNISIDSSFAGLGGEINASGQTGGTITVNTRTLSLADKIYSQGEKQGGIVNLNVEGKTWETATSVIDVSGGEGGTINHIAGQQITTSGQYLAVGNTGTGGNINMTAPVLKCFSTKIDASGETGGGYIQLGGEYQGGKNLETDVIPNAKTLIVNDSSEIKAYVLGEAGDGGTIISWADKKAIVLGDYSAKPGSVSGEGGFVEISSGDKLTFAGDVQTGIGDRSGTVLFDPKNLIVTDSNIDNCSLVITHSVRDSEFGYDVSLDGRQLAVGAIEDSGYSDDYPL